MAMITGVKGGKEGGEGGMVGSEGRVIGKTGVEGGKAVIGVDGGKLGFEVVSERGAVGNTGVAGGKVGGEGSVIGKTGTGRGKAIAGVEVGKAGSGGGTSKPASKAQIFSYEPRRHHSAPPGGTFRRNTADEAQVQTSWTASKPSENVKFKPETIGRKEPVSTRV